MRLTFSHNPHARASTETICPDAAVASDNRFWLRVQGLAWKELGRFAIDAEGMGTNRNGSGSNPKRPARLDARQTEIDDEMTPSKADHEGRALGHAFEHRQRRSNTVGAWKAATAFRLARCLWPST